ncbi:MAG TPA: hypothetical protein VJX67_16180, partial [Blastocatellia bacterium]|nr:hypothetical protein [Blastocatellia bacterium]
VGVKALPSYTPGRTSYACCLNFKTQCTSALKYLVVSPKERKGKLTVIWRQNTLADLAACVDDAVVDITYNGAPVTVTQSRDSTT